MHAISCYIGPRYNGTQLYGAVTRVRWVWTIVLYYLVQDPGTPVPSTHPDDDTDEDLVCCCAFVEFMGM